MINGDYLFQDPPEDEKFPFTQIPIKIESEGYQLLGLIEVTTGEGPHPTIILLHGFPGNEQNIDLSQALKRIGFNVILFHYKGSWGSPGNFSFSSCIEDTRSVIKFALNDENARKYRIDVSRISLIGHSMGGFLGIMVLQEFDMIRNLVAISPVNFFVFAENIPEDAEGQKEWGSKSLSNALGPLRGTTSQFLVYDMINNKNHWNTTSVISSFINKKVLLIAGSKDVDIPPSKHFEPLVNLKLDFVEHKVFSTEHQFSNCRIELIKFIANWMISKN